MSNKKLDSKKLIGILEGALTVVVGILVAVFGIQTVLDIYFGIIFVVAGAFVLGFECYTLSKTKVLPFSGLFGGLALVLLGSFLLAGQLTFAVLIGILIVLILALGAALVLHGVYTIVKVNFFYGLGQIVIGVAAIVLGTLYITIPDFRTVFWIVIGVLIALYGCLLIAVSLVTKEK